MMEGEEETSTIGWQTLAGPLIWFPTPGDERSSLVTSTLLFIMESFTERGAASSHKDSEWRVICLSVGARHWAEAAHVSEDEDESRDEDN
jgi:hypothetical protein